MKFAKATKKSAKLRLALIGPSGAGKTYTSLALARELGARVAVIDTERGSASKYADLFEFDVLELDSFAPQSYIEAIRAAEREGYDVIVIDSLSHAWSGKDGALEQVDRVAKRSQSGSTFNAWREVTPQHNALVDAIVTSRCHIIASMRAKTEYVIETNAKGKQVPRKIGLAPIQRDGLEYEFDVVGTMTLDNDLIVDKTRCPALAGQVFARPGADLANVLKNWLVGDGTQPPSQSPGLKNIEPDYLQLLHSAQDFEQLDTAVKAIAKAIPKGDPRRPALLRAHAERKKWLEENLPQSDTNGFTQGMGPDESAA